MKYNKTIDSYISYCLEFHEVKISKDHPDSIFWIKSQEVIVEITKSKTFWLRSDIWKSISKMFDLDYDDTQSVIKEWLEQPSNLGGLTPTYCKPVSQLWLEQHPNLEGLTPRLHDSPTINLLEQHPNLG